MLPYTVMKTTQFKIIIEFYSACAGPRSILYMESIRANNAHPVLGRHLNCANITCPYFAGLVDGGGCVYVNKSAGSVRKHSQEWNLYLHVTQEKSPDLLMELQSVYGGNLSVANKGGLLSRLNFTSKESIAAVWVPLRQYICMVIKLVKLDTLLEHMFHVNLHQTPLRGASVRRAFRRRITYQEIASDWTAVHWRNLLLQRGQKPPSYSK